MKLPPIVKVPLIRGDTATITCALTLDGAPYTVPASSIVLFSVKLNSSDLDLDCLFQKVLGYGLTLTGTDAVVSVVPQDTVNVLAGAVYVADVQVQEPNGRVVTPWLGALPITDDITKNLQSSLPVYTTNPPLPVANGLGAPTYTHNQATPALEWVVDHNLNAVVGVTVLDLDGNEVVATVTHPTLNQARVSFSTATAGKARVS